MTDPIVVPFEELRSLEALAYTAEQRGGNLHTMLKVVITGLIEHDNEEGFRCCESLMALLEPLVDSLSHLQDRLSTLLPPAEEAP
jgi:hypothetical protein